MLFLSTQYQVIDATLFEIQEYLVALSKQIELLAPADDRRGAPWTASMEAEHAIGNLRQKLKDAQPNDSKGEVLVEPGLILA